MAASVEDRVVHVVSASIPDNAPGIVFCWTRKKTEVLAAYLTRSGHPALFYHAGKTAGEKTAATTAWMANDPPIMVATVAFGLGIDRPDVRFVIIAGMAPSLSLFAQMAGRAGRNNRLADAIMVYTPTEYSLILERINSSFQERIAEIARLNSTAKPHTERMASKICI